MSNYKQSEINGTQWQRCKTVVIANPLDGTPSITFHEELVFNMEAGTITKDVPGHSFHFDPSEVIHLLDVETGTPTGATLTAAEVYIALYSMYIKKALERDAG